MTPIPKVFVVSRSGAGPAVLAAVLLTIALHLWTAPFFTAAKAEVVDPRMESACKWPTREGMMTVVTVMAGKLVCWRWE